MKQDASLVTVGGKKPKKRLTAAQRQKKRRLQKMIAGGIFFMLIAAIWFGLQPLRGTAEYGICRTYAELQSTNPETLKIISYENYGMAWKVFYTFTGQYGEQRSNFIDCTFIKDASGQSIISEVKINRQAAKKSDVTLFNKTIPAILAAKPNLIIPPPLEEADLMGLRTIVETEEE